MAQLEVIALDTAVPQLRAPGGSDTYLMPKDLTIQGTATVDSGATINGGAVFNETGADVDFRIESDTVTNAFFVDGATGNVGIRTSSPGYQLEIENANTSFRMTDLGANSTYVSALTVATQAQIGVARQGANPSSAFLIAAGNTSNLSLNGLSGTANLITTESNGDLSIDVGGSERMRIDSSGRVGIGGTAAAFSKLAIAGTLPTSSNLSVGLDIVGTIPSGTTSGFDGVLTRSVTAAASFTLTNLHNFRATQGTLGAGSTVTNQYGFVADSSLTGATNNYGFYSDIASAANRWNFYAAGTAANYFAGNVGIGDSTPLAKLHVSNGAVLSSVNAGADEFIIERNAACGMTIASGNASAGNIFFADSDSETVGRIVYDHNVNDLSLWTSNTERLTIDSSGNVIVNTAAIATTATDGFLYVPSCAGTPTGTPTSYTGRVPIVVDTTNNKLYFYSNGTWRDAGP